MLIEKYLDMESAEKGELRPEKDYIYVRHNLRAGEKIPWHCHPEANEIILIKEGTFLLAVGKERELIWLAKGNKVRAIRLFKGEKHSLVAISRVSYVVYKTAMDRSIPCGGPDLKKELKKILPEIERMASSAFQKEE